MDFLELLVVLLLCTIVIMVICWCFDNSATYERGRKDGLHAAQFTKKERDFADKHRLTYDEARKVIASIDPAVVDSVTRKNVDLVMDHLQRQARDEKMKADRAMLHNTILRKQ